MQVKVYCNLHCQHFGFGCTPYCNIGNEGKCKHNKCTTVLTFRWLRISVRVSVLELCIWGRYNEPREPRAAKSTASQAAAAE